MVPSGNDFCLVDVVDSLVDSSRTQWRTFLNPYRMSGPHVLSWHHGRVTAY